MHHTVQLFPDLATAYVRFSGDLTLDELQAMLRSHAEDPNWQGIRQVLSDHRLSTVALSSDELRIHVEGAADIQRPLKLERVVAIHPSDVGFGLGRMFQSLAEVHLKTKYSVVRTPDEALALLKLDDAGRVRLTEALAV